MGSERTKVRSPRVWAPGAAAALLAATSVLLIQLVTVPAGPPGGCAWGGPCTLDARGAVVSALVMLLGAATVLGFLARVRLARRAAFVGLLALVAAPLWAQLAVRGHGWGPLPL